MTNWKEKIGKDGRHLVHSTRTGKTYLVEPITPHANKLTSGWGDQVGDKITGDYGNKHVGAIVESESVITEDNGFKNIVDILTGTSPYSEIEKIDSQYPTI